MMDVREKTMLTKEGQVLGSMVSMGHEQVLFCNDEKTGLKAIIAVHSTVLGPSLGGTRMWNYTSEQEALEDVLRLSRGMTYKASISGLNLGGGKAVIIGDSKTDKSEALFRRFGQFVNSLNGTYITAEDVGIDPQNISWVSQETDHVAGLPEKGGDPSPVTAYGVYMGMKAAAKKQWGNDSLEGKTVAVQGVGHVGMYLVDCLAKENANIVVTDIDENAVAKAVSEHCATAVSLDEIYDVNMDIYAPCALGATVNDETLMRLKCSIIAGAANNQLANEQNHGHAVMDKGIIYAPDFLINAGGLINCYSELHGYDRDRAMSQTEKIYQTTLDIIKMSKAEGIPTYMAANRIAEERIEKNRK
ncbi:MAG: Glu/Leu/Phe/Val dehydrogenase [Flavobacteriales bacterium]|nr:Glu/Leu/Phe/Val dehydrogenase [Flavobacteriales bacterium]